MNPTKNDLRGDLRKGAVELLNGALATAIDLQLAAKQAHWNVKGPHFLALHGLFDQVYAQAATWVDELAERAVALGGIADGTLAGVTARTKLAAYPARAVAGDDHVSAIAERLARFAAQTRASIHLAGELGDDVTSDLFNEVTGQADKQLWMVEAHLQS